MGRLVLARIWNRLSLIARLTVISSLLFLLGGTLLLYLLVTQIADNQRVVLAETLQDQIQILAPIIGEYAVVGDYASIQQTLSARIKRADIQRVEWKDAYRKIIRADDSSVNQLQAPAWFGRWVALPKFTTVKFVEVGGANYGSILLELSPTPTVNFIWRTLQKQVVVIALISVVFYGIVVLFFWHQLSPLQALVKGTQKFGEGDYSIRIEPASAPEIQSSIHAFNHMANTIQNLLASTVEKEAHLSAVMNNVDDAIIILDERHIVESFNQATEHLFGSTSELLLGRPLMSLLAGPWIEKENAPDDFFQGLEVETEGRRGDGSLFPIEFKIKPMQSQCRSLFMANIRDISKRRHAEALHAQSREWLETYQASTELELKLAHHVFQTITNENMKKPASLELWTFPMGLFNGDLLLFEHSPSGNLHIMLCDFTGHGLGAAIGAIPASDVFLSMSKKGYAIPEIALQINRKLKHMLPTGHFCAACLISINYDDQGIEIWNGGLPPVLIVGNDGNIIRRVLSNKLPLGIVRSSEFDAQTEMFSLQGVRSAFIYSDGLTEARNPLDEMLGQDALEQMIQATQTTDSWLESIKEKVTEFIDDCELSDDLSLLHVQCNVCHVTPAPITVSDSQKPTTTLPGYWHIELQLSGAMLKNGAHLPLLMNWLIELNFPELQRAHLYTILSELINNSVDHGLLLLESTLKTTPDGFQNYYTMRQKLLEHLDHGMLTIRLSQKPQSQSKKLIHISIKDTGCGFDFSQIFSQLNDNERNFGRGIGLVNSLCSNLSYQGCGNEVIAAYAVN